MLFTFYSTFCSSLLRVLTASNSWGHRTVCHKRYGVPFHCVKLHSARRWQKRSSHCTCSRATMLFFWDKETEISQCINGKDQAWSLLCHDNMSRLTYFINCMNAHYFWTEAVIHLIQQQQKRFNYPNPWHIWSVLPLISSGSRETIRFLSIERWNVPHLMVCISRWNDFCWQRLCFRGPTKEVICLSVFEVDS